MQRYNINAEQYALIRKAFDKFSDDLSEFYDLQNFFTSSIEMIKKFNIAQQNSESV
jgi:hypothetical protein